MPGFFLSLVGTLDLQSLTELTLYINTYIHSSGPRDSPEARSKTGSDTHALTLIRSGSENGLGTVRLASA